MKKLIFENIPEDCFSHAKIKIKSIKKGGTLFDEGDKVDYIYFLEEGELNILRNRQIVWQAQTDEFIGISSYFNGEQNYTCHVKAAKKSTLLQITTKDFEIALLEYPELSRSLMNIFNNRINLIFKKTRCYATLTRKKRLFKMIMDKMERVENKYIFNYNSEDIAEFIGVSHHFIKRTLLSLQEMKLIVFNKDMIEIVDYKGFGLISK